jgi:hypothetical protein
MCSFSLNARLPFSQKQSIIANTAVVHLGPPHQLKNYGLEQELIDVEGLPSTISIPSTDDLPGTITVYHPLLTPGTSSRPGRHF